MSVIRDVAESDIPVFFEHQRDPEAMDMAKMPARDEEAFRAHWQKILADDAATTKTIVFGDEVAGNLLIFDRGGKRLVGYWIGREFWGKGLATMALAELLVEETTRPLHAYVATSNVGSMRVLEKCGFTLVGRETEFDEALDEEIEEALFVLKA
ncbi:MAG: GNAT family N-acetyltransferase [Actinomycetota bacterium]